MEILFWLPAHREEQSRAVERHLEISDQPRGHVQQCRGLAIVRKVDCADRRAQENPPRADLAYREVRPGIVVVTRILLPHDVNDLVLPQNRMQQLGGEDTADRQDDKRH